MCRGAFKRSLVEILRFTLALKRFICLIIVCAAATRTSRGDLDLTPLSVTRVMNNIRFCCPYFLDGETRYSVNLPAGVTFVSDGGGTLFRFAETGGAVFLMRPSPLKPKVLFEEPDLKLYRKAALSFVPASADSTAIQKEQPNPLPMNNWNSYRFTVSSNVSGVSTIQEITFLNFSDTQQIVLITTADSRYFDQAAQKSFEIINSFHALRRGEDLSAPVTP